MNKRIFIFLLLSFCLTVRGFGVMPKGDTMDDQAGREEKIKAYIEEFVSGTIIQSRPKTLQAIRQAFDKLPEDVYAEVTDRRRPIIFLDYYTVGIARFASSTEFIVREDDAPMMQEGFYIIKLGDALESGDIEAIEGIVLHEIAHRYLEHLRMVKTSCEQEREANRLIKAWGCEKEFNHAKEVFGAKDKSDSPCFEEPSTLLEQKGAESSGSSPSD